MYMYIMYSIVGCPRRSLSQVPRGPGGEPMQSAIIYNIHMCIYTYIYNVCVYIYIYIYMYAYIYTYK